MNPFVEQINDNYLFNDQNKDLITKMCPSPFLAIFLFELFFCGLVLHIQHMSCICQCIHGLLYITDVDK